MIRCEKHLVSKTERSANQSEGCDARRKARYGPPAALCSATLFDYAEMCRHPPKGKPVRGYGEVYGISFSGHHDHPALERSGGLKHR